MDADRQAVVRWLDKWKPGKCPVCHMDNWAIPERLFQISNLDYAGNLIPVFPIGCDTCGYILMLHARLAGLMPEENEEPAVETPEASSADAEEK